MIGQHFPPFTLPLYPGIDTYSSTALIGQWTLLHYFHASFSAVCATELAMLAQLHEEVPNVHVVSVCPDSMLSLVGWVDIELNKMADLSSILILSDSGHVLRSALGLHPDERALYVIDRDCTIQAELHQASAIGINIKECARILQALQFASSADGQCTPADWVPGRPGVPPGASHIGHTWESWPTVDRKEPM